MRAEALFDIWGVGAEGCEEYGAVFAPEAVEDVAAAVWPEAEEYGVVDCNYVEALQALVQTVFYAPPQFEPSESAAVAAQQVDVALGVHPHGAVGCHNHFLPELPQAGCKGAVEVAGVAQ